jgi:hypothetical protein
MGDPSNESICSVLIKLGVWGDDANEQVLLQDGFCRHTINAQHSSDSSKTPPFGTFIQALHRAFSDYVWDCGEAKFGIILAQHSTDRYVKGRPRNQTICFRPWLHAYYGSKNPPNDDSDIAITINVQQIVLVKLDNDGPNRQVRCLVFAMFHPEYCLRTSCYATTHWERIKFLLALRLRRKPMFFRAVLDKSL